MRAIDVGRISSAWLLNFGVSRDGAIPSSIPTASVDLAVTNPSDVAVLSWRWDVDPALQISRNASVAIAEAARRGVRYLFMDKVSIDQTLAGDALMRAVVDFSALYSQIAVFAAYDQQGVDKTQWTRIMRRPWILREARAFRANAHPVVYVGHVRDQGATDDIGFKHMLDRIWGSSFTHSILHVLCGQAGMHTTADLRYIMPEHSEILSVAHDTMSRNDFLLTAAILAQVPVGDFRLNEEIDLAEVQFDRYTLSDADGGEYDNNKSIALDGTQVATWFSHYNLYMGHQRRKLEVAPDAERLVHERLGRSDRDFERYSARAEARRESLIMPKPADAGSPPIEMVYVGEDA